MPTVALVSICAGGAALIMVASTTPTASWLLPALSDAASRRSLPDLDATTLRVGTPRLLRRAVAIFPPSAAVAADGTVYFASGDTKDRLDPVMAKLTLLPRPEVCW